MSGAIYNDFTQFTTLRAEATKNPNAALEEVASQFEAIFLQQMLKSMRDATMKSDLFDSSQMDTYQSMADQQMALQLAESGGMGLARMMVEQMQSRGYVPAQGETFDASLEDADQSAMSGNAKSFRQSVANAYEIGSKD